MLHQNFSLKNYNTFGLEVSAEYFFEYDSVHALVDFIKDNTLGSMPHFFLGGGSNVLFINNFKGLILYSKIGGYETVYEDHDSVHVRVGAGVEWDDFVAWAVENNLGGIENLSLIPGHVGASPVQNIGAYGVEAKDVIDVVEAVNYTTGKICKFMNSECEFGYRDSIFKHAFKNNYVVTRVTFRLLKKPEFVLDYGNVKSALNEKFDAVSLQNIRETIIEIRESKLPDHKKIGNAGSFFMNPIISKKDFEDIKNNFDNPPHYLLDDGVKVPAAWLIDQCGLKGYAIGGAQVNEKQPLVIINTGTATADDIVALSAHVRQTVRERFNIELKSEVNFIE